MDDNSLIAEFENSRSGRLDAVKIAAAFGVRLATLAKMLQAEEGALRRCPDAEVIQEPLKDAVAAYGYLCTMLPLDDTIAKWMHHPSPSLDGATPIELAQSHGMIALRELVGAMVAGNYL